jgi:gluconate 2-dehydrogenase gamma chain
MNPETLRAVVDCLIPPDDFPGAYEAGVCDYVERLLQTDLAEHADFFRAGIDAIEAEALARFNKSFANLSSTQQVATLTVIESAVPRFFEMLVNTTAEGYYTEPISWVMTGFEDLSTQL